MRKLVLTTFFLCFACLVQFNVHYFAEKKQQKINVIAIDDNTDYALKHIKKSFKDPHVVGIVLNIRSAVEYGDAYEFFSTIKGLKKQYPHKKIFSYVENTGHAGALLLAASTDRSYALNSNLLFVDGRVGSVVKNDEFLAKMGVKKFYPKGGKHKTTFQNLEALQIKEVFHILETEKKFNFSSEEKQNKRALVLNDLLKANMIQTKGNLWEAVECLFIESHATAIRQI